MLRILVFILVVAVIYGLLERITLFGDKPGVSFLVGLVIAIIGVRLVPLEWLLMAAAPSGALVVLITTGIPFLIVGYFLMNEKPIIRHAGWYFFLLATIFMWVYNFGRSGFFYPFGYAYMLVIVLVVVALFTDGTLIRIWKREQNLGMKESVDEMAKARVMQDLETAETAHRQALEAGDKNLAARHKRTINKLRKELASFS